MLLLFVTCVKTLKKETCIMSYLKKVAIFFCGMGFIPSCHATNSLLNSEEMDSVKLQQIFKKYSLPNLSPTEDRGQTVLTSEVAEEIAKEVPNVAKKIISENRYELSHFETYSVGIPSTVDLSLEKSRLEEEVQLLEAALQKHK